MIAKQRSQGPGDLDPNATGNLFGVITTDLAFQGCTAPWYFLPSPSFLEG